MSIVDVRVPLVNANEDIVEVLRWTVDDGEQVEAGQSIVDLGTTKAAVSVESPSVGFLVHVQESGAMVPVHGVLARVVSTREEIDAARTAPVSGGSSVASAAAGGPARLSKAAQAMAAEAGIDTASMAGLVTARQLRERQGLVRVEPLDRVKRAEVGALWRAREVLDSSVSIQLPVGARVESLLPLLVCEVAQLLADYPVLNGYYIGDAIELRSQVDLGIALDLGRGLRVVTVQEAEQATPADVELQLYDFTDRYLSDTLTPEDITPATFTITDLSALGASAMAPLIGEWQAAILAVTGGTAEAGTPITLTLVFDHRVSNGRTAAMFLSDLRDRVMPQAVIDAPAPAAPVAAVEAAPVYVEAPPAVDSRRCDRCGTDVAVYYDKYPRDAFMQVWMRPDGTLALMCHICNSGAF
jgi:pyruvate/2-oxoglutarate dehydrogenase complex dihydrolipoamide acyltransferase (E2) component